MAENNLKIDIQEMTETGMHLGHKTSKLNPKMEEYIVGIKNTVHVLDLEKTAVLLQKALDYIIGLVKQGGVLMLVGTKPPLKRLVQATAKEAGLPYVFERWLGGTFTNFEVLQKRARYFREKEQEKTEGKLEKYTKKERLKIEKDLSEMKNKFEGVKNLEKLPQAVFICDIVKDNLCLKEATMKGIKTIAIVDTNADPSSVDFPIPANDDALNSVGYILERVKQAVLLAQGAKGQVTKN